MELYRIFYQTTIGAFPKYVDATNPREAQKQFYKDYPMADILECEHIGEKVNTKCKVIKKEDLE